jgi:hypothetical protein
MRSCTTIIPDLEKVKYNAILYAITNRRNGFELDLPEPTWFDPKPQSVVWTQLQAGLCLDNSLTDYYPKLALTILAAYPGVLDVFPDNKLTFSLSDNTYAKSKFTAGGFTSVGRNIGKFKNYTDIFPVPKTYRVKYKSKKQLIVETDIGRKYISSYNKSKRDKDSVLLVDWHERLPFTGPMLFEGDWSETSNIDITYVPYGLNYKDWIQYIETKMDILEPLNKVGLLTCYRISDCYTEKLAILVVTLALLNTSMGNSR